jgi:hypothetical protein
MRALCRFALVVGFALAAELSPAGASPRAAALSSRASAHELKANFLFNFIKFTAWPTDVLPAGTPLDVCVFGDSPVATPLEGFSGHVVDGHALMIGRVGDPSDLPVCHLVFIGAAESQRAASALDAVHQRPASTVLDHPDFLQHGGMIGFVLEDHRLRFDINQAAAQRVHVKISAHLPRLARQVGEGTQP